MKQTDTGLRNARQAKRALSGDEVMSASWFASESKERATKREKRITRQNAKEEEEQPRA